LSRLILLIVLGVVATYYIPESREAMVELVQPALAPVFRWQSAQEMSRIAREVQLYERENLGRVPDQRRFPSWLNANFTEGAARDSWGGEYLLFVERDSFAIVSWGPDLLPRTEDDLRVARELARSLR
jgi:hypothetical protein